MSRARARWQTLPAFTQDALFAGALTACGVTEAALEHGHGSRAATIAATVVLGVAVLLRRRNALLAVILVNATVLGQAALGGLLLKNGLAGPLMAVIVAYSLGAYAEGAALWAGVTVQAAGFAIGGLAFGTGNKASDMFFGVLLGCVLPVAAGIAVHDRRRLVAELHERSRQLVAERERSAESAVAAERARIAGELHDVVSHNVSVMVVQAGAARRLIKTDPARASEAMMAIESTGRAALDEMRRLLGVLRRGDEELALAPQPTLRRVDRLVALARQDGLDARLHVEGDAVELPLGLDVAAYRIVQEALRSAQAHAPGARADVVVRYGRSDLELEVVNGPPATGHEITADSVLVGLRERVALFGGNLRAGRRRGGGYTLRAKLPLAEATP